MKFLLFMMDLSEIDEQIPVNLRNRKKEQDASAPKEQDASAPKEQDISIQQTS